jgi:hypothetical protein
MLLGCLGCQVDSGCGATLVTVLHIVLLLLLLLSQ